MIKIIENKNKFGIINGKGQIIIPFTHNKPLSALGEWRYYEEQNTMRRQFLEYKLSLDLIERICKTSYLNYLIN